MPFKPHSLQSSQPNSRLYPLIIALLIAPILMALVAPPSSGLDQGWLFGLTKAHEQGLVWGKDIIFTYGPFSYLFFGSLIKGHFFEMQISRYLLTVAWLFLSLRFAFQLEKWVFQLCAIVALVFIPSALYSNGAVQFIVLEETKFVIIIVLMILKVSAISLKNTDSKDSHSADIPPPDSGSHSGSHSLQRFISHLNRPSTQLYFYGSICAFFLLVKLNLGLFSIVCCAIAIASSLLHPISHRSGKPAAEDSEGQREENRNGEFANAFRLPSWIIRYLAALQSTNLRLANCFLFGFLSGILFYFSPLNQHPFWAVLLSWIPGLLVWQCRRITQLKFCYKISPSQILLLLIGAIGAVLLIHPNIRSFLVGSLQLINGYSQSMTLIGPDSELLAGGLLFAMILLFVAITGLLVPHHLGKAIALCLLAYMSFKHGFSRHDPQHTLLFAAIAPVYLFMLGTFIISQPHRRAMRQVMQSLELVWCFCWALSIVFILGLGSPSTIFTKSYHLSLEHYRFLLSSPHVTSQFIALFNPQQAEQTVLNQQTAAVAASELQPSLLANLIRDESIDILPWSVAAVAANHFQNWQPAPVFQAYAAFTRWLDAQNLTSYQANLRSRILYSFASIDGRHPYFDQPQTTLFLICNYQPIALPQGQLAAMAEIGPTAILEPRQTPRCSPEAKQPIGQPETVGWNETIDLDQVRAAAGNEPNTLLLAKIDVQYSFLGKIYSKLFRTPPVMMQVTDEQGQQMDFRVVLDTAKSGVLIGSLPKSIQSSLQIFEGAESQDRVKTIDFFSPHQQVFKPYIQVEFERLIQQVQPAA